jgi:hypothetical protein
VLIGYEMRVSRAFVMFVQHHELMQWPSRGMWLRHTHPSHSHHAALVPWRPESWVQSMMRYYKPLVYSAIAIIYASFAFRVGRLGLLSRALKPRTEAKTQAT